MFLHLNFFNYMFSVLVSALREFVRVREDIEHEPLPTGTQQKAIPSFPFFLALGGFWNEYHRGRGRKEIVWSFPHSPTFSGFLNPPSLLFFFLSFLPPFENWDFPSISDPRLRQVLELPLFSHLVTQEDRAEWNHQGSMHKRNAEASWKITHPKGTKSQQQKCVSKITGELWNEGSFWAQHTSCIRTVPLFSHCGFTLSLQTKRL